METAARAVQLMSLAPSSGRPRRPVKLGKGIKIAIASYYKAHYGYHRDLDIGIYTPVYRFKLGSLTPAEYLPV